MLSLITLIFYLFGWISSNDGISRHIFRNYRSGRNHGSIPYGNSTQDDRMSANPDVIAYPHRFVVEINVCRMAGAGNCREMAAPLFPSHRMGQIVEDGNTVSDQHVIANRDFDARPDAGVLPNVT